MERVELPTGITIDGRELYFREKQVKDTKSKPVPIERYLKRTRSIKGAAFNKDKPLSKLQRVIETSVYDNKQIKDYVMQEYHDKFKEELYERFQESSLSDILICIFGCNDQWKTNADIVELAAQVNKEKRRTLSLITGSSFSYFLSNYWTKSKCISLFVDRSRHTKGRSGRKVYSHRMSEIGLKIGAHELIRIMNKKIPNDFTKLRLRLSNCRLAAKHNGVSESEFNKYIEKRFNESMGLVGKVDKLKTPPIKRTTVKVDIDDMPLKEVVENTPIAVAPEPSFALPSEPDDKRKTNEGYGLGSLLKPVGEGVPVVGKPSLENSVIPDSQAGSKVSPEPKSFSKITFNIKVWIIPITGEIELI